VLKVEKLNKKIGNRTILTDISFKLDKGEIVGFVGPNGAGKTTTLKCIMGLLRSQYDSIQIGDVSLKTDFENAIQNIVYMSDSNVFFNKLSAFDNLSLLQGFYKKTKDDIKKSLEQVGLGQRMHDKVATYSFGMKQRLALAKCFCISPKVIIMDEPFNGVDISGVAELRNIIKSLANMGATLLISSHNMAELVQVCDRMIVINDGKILGELQNDKDPNSMESKFLDMTGASSKLGVVSLPIQTPSSQSNQDQ